MYSVEARYDLLLGYFVLGEVSEFARYPASDGVVASDNSSADWAELLVDALLVVMVRALRCVLEMGMVSAGRWVVWVVRGWSVGEGGGRQQ